MIVVGVMGVILTMGVPLVYRLRHEVPLRKAVRDVVEVCSHARAMAILQSKAICVVFHPKELTFSVGGAGNPDGASNHAFEGAEPAPHPTAAASRAGTAGIFSDRIIIEMLDVDLSEYKDADEVKVWFYPNGVCDELTLILYDPTMDRDPRRAIAWEVTTGLAHVETDPRNLLTRKR